MTKTNYQRVIDDIRAGRTELVWKERKNPLVFLFDTQVLNGYSFSITISGRVVFWEKRGSRLALCDAHPIPKPKLLNEIQIGENPGNLYWPLIAPTLKETQAKLQQIYNDYLLEEARKKDEGVAV